ncbi:hypothetical protein [Pseudomonas brassicacearum]|uniref:hypothetical protein n=1 Tax=Pseudomonas brassicacearum TaxID=930166 RepID=UPI003ED125C7
MTYASASHRTVTLVGSGKLHGKPFAIGLWFPIFEVLQRHLLAGSIDHHEYPKQVPIDVLGMSETVIRPDVVKASLGVSYVS